jgi:hypothetical protein
VAVPYFMSFIKASKTSVFSTRQDTLLEKHCSDNTKIDLIFWTFKKLPAHIHPRETFRLTKEENAHRLINAMSCEDTSMARHVKSKYSKEQYSQ